MARRFQVTAAGASAPYVIDVRPVAGTLSCEVSLAGTVPVTVERLPDGTLRWFEGTQQVLATAEIRRGGDAAIAGGKAAARVFVGDAEVDVVVEDARRAHAAALARRAGTASAGRAVMRAPMPGKVVGVVVKVGDVVKAGQSLVVLEAMKMENEMLAPRDGRVLSVAAVVGKTVEAGAELVTLEAQET